MLSVQAVGHGRRSSQAGNDRRGERGYFATTTPEPISPSTRSSGDPGRPPSVTWFLTAPLLA
ncbi:hypothetical protein ACW2Q0_01215 [Nocardia sp. R16R-3T]